MTCDVTADAEIVRFASAMVLAKLRKQVAVIHDPASGLLPTSAREYPHSRNPMLLPAPLRDTPIECDARMTLGECEAVLVLGYYPYFELRASMMPDRMPIGCESCGTELHPTSLLGLP